MKALLLTEPFKLEHTDLPDPQPNRGEALLRIRACGICGSDIHGWDGSSRRRQPPLIMGHEAAGEIVKLGSDTDGWQVGDRVTFDSTLSCGGCKYCHSGFVNLCMNRRVFGVSTDDYRQHGAFAEYLAVPARLLYRLPKNLSFPVAAMVEPVSIAVHAVKQSGIRPGGTAVVVGAGLIGLLVIQVLRWNGVTKIIAVDLADNRLALARKLGASHAILSHAGTSKEIKALSDGDGVDFAFEVVGLTPTVNLAVGALRRGGSCVLIGNLSPYTKDFPLQAVVTQELRVIGSCASAGEYCLALDLLARGAVKVDSIISAVAPLDQGMDWFKKLSAEDGSSFMKVILTP